MAELSTVGIQSNKVYCFSSENGNREAPGCQGCDQRVVKLKLGEIQEVFRSGKSQMKSRLLHFVSSQIATDPDLIPVVHLLLLSKDGMYEMSKREPVKSYSLLSLTDEDVASGIFNDFERWFKSSNKSTKFKIIYGILKLINPSGINNIKSLVSLQNTKACKYHSCEARLILEKSARESSLRISNNGEQTELDKIPFSGVQEPFRNGNPPTNKVGWISTETRQYWPAATSAIRCLPFASLVPETHSKKDNELLVCKGFRGCLKGLGIKDSFSKLSCLDFIPLLPIHISKSIFGRLDSQSLENCLCVSRMWREIAEGVKDEQRLVNCDDQDALLIEGGQQLVTNYAKIIPMHIPCLDDNNNIIPNSESEHVNIEEERNEFEGVDMRDCYTDIETKTIQFEERNIFCGAYNVILLLNHKDPHRIISSTDGSTVVSGSVDGKLRITEVSTAKNLRTFYAHVGSIRSIQLTIGNAFMLSGSYDTSVRFWSLSSGRCRFIFRGHRASITCLTVHGHQAASGCIDKTVRVWNLSSGRCKMILKHSSVVRAVKINHEYLVSGCNDGQVLLWLLKTGSIIKVLRGHMGRVTSLAFNQYHIASGSHDKYVLTWCMLGDLTSCLRALKHKSEVLCLEMMFGRVITGSVDGKIRIWNLLNGECMRVIRGNSKNDAIRQLLAFDTRLVINTESNVLVYEFERIHWDYNAKRSLEPSHDAGVLSADDDNKPRKPHSYHRAMRLRIYGSSIDLRQTTTEVSTASRRRVQSAAPQRTKPRTDGTDVKQRCRSAYTKRIVRIASSEDKLDAIPASTRDTITSGLEDVTERSRRRRPKTAPPRVGVKNSACPTLTKEDLNLKSYYQIGDRMYP